MSAWQVLTQNSNAPDGSTAWLHLTNQTPFSLQIFAAMEAELMADLEAELDPELTAQLEDELTATLEPELTVEVG